MRGKDIGVVLEHQHSIQPTARRYQLPISALTTGNDARLERSLFRFSAISPSSNLCAIEDKNVWQALIHEVPGHGQGLEVGRNVDFTSFHNLAFEFFG